MRSVLSLAVPLCNVRFGSNSAVASGGRSVAKRRVSPDTSPLHWEGRAAAKMRARGQET
jgi:hypothetical protein